jgi:macrolide transport system ATP-binding/permease protein
VQTRSIQQLRAVELKMAPGATSSVEPHLRRALAEIDPGMNVLRVRSMDQQISFSFRVNRLMSTLTAAYGLLALALASLGLYGVTAYGVSRRRREIGVRMALGAEPGRVVLGVIRSATLQTAVGLAIGIPIALLSGNAVATLLYGVEPRDPVVLSSAALALLVSAVLAAVVPARRAAAVNPTEALRGE